MHFFFELKVGYVSIILAAPALLGGRRKSTKNVRITMRILNIALVLLLAASVVCDSSKKKLQIGIKKRVDNCTLKSKRGDTLFVNYVVGDLITR